MLVASVLSDDGDLVFGRASFDFVAVADKVRVLRHRAGHHRKTSKLLTWAVRIAKNLIRAY